MAYGFGNGYSGGPGGGYSLNFPQLGIVTKRLIIANVVVFFVNALFFSRAGGSLLFEWFGLSRVDMFRGMIWQLVTYQFLHAGLFHLLFNMLGLYFFGTELEQRLGVRRFILLYIGGGVLGGLGWVLLTPVGVCIGASGSLYAVVGAFAALFPHRRITLLVFFILPVTLTARMMAILFGAFSLLMLGSPGSGVAHAAHLAGGVAGYLYALRLMQQAGVRSGFNRSSGHFWNNMRAQWRRRHFTVHDSPSPMSDPASSEEQPVDWDQVDAILAKIKLRGMGALSPREREMLDRASRAAEKR